ncbi:glycoside hydrolase [Fistulina hepatica ATCC 64428]|uniref:alpha-1,2-Mannosidase n=1 Tax=Fistulina hepatica ATCC 64428 TaxID=1128425 RepID=A0A0D7AGL2_9AGAR|nr:glycoside hydrolase [Fistulina hepatica ATCC 64428]
MFQNLGSISQHIRQLNFRPVARWDGLSSGPVDFSADIPKRDAVLRAFKHAWHAYERDAMGDDEYHPISKKGTNLMDAGGIGFTVVDAIDTMQIMGLDDEYQRARNWVEKELTFDRDDKVSTFETTIRVLGGLLSAHHLSGDELYLKKAVDLADRIIPAFDTKSGLPLPLVNLAASKGMEDPDSPGVVSTAEVTTLQLEFRYLSFLTDNDIYWQKVEKVMRTVKGARMPQGVSPIYMSPETGLFLTGPIRLGSRGDSFYEYLLKQYLQTAETEDVYREMYEDAVQAITDHLLRRSVPNNHLWTVELIPERDRKTGELRWKLTPKQDHLVCFFGGSLMLGATTAGALVHPVSIPPQADELTDSGRRDWKNGIDLIDSCLYTHNTSTGLSPEIVRFHLEGDGTLYTGTSKDWYIEGAKLPGQDPPYDARYILRRPETVESLFLAFRLTGDAKYRQYGWEIFQSIEEHCRVESGGYASIINVDENPARMEDKMETFFVSETLKYLYLLFEDSSIMPLDKYVFNTEAHPLPIFHPHIRTGFM